MKQDLTKRIGTALLATATVACVLIALLNFAQRRQIERAHDGVVWADSAGGGMWASSYIPSKSEGQG